MLRSLNNYTKPKDDLQAMKKKIRIFFVESLNHNPNLLNKITIEIDELLIDCEYINLFMQMYMQWSRDDGSTSSFRKLIIPHLPCFDKLSLSEFRLYIETEQ